MQNKTLENIHKLKHFIDELNSHGIDVEKLSSKIKEAIQVLNSTSINIALLGSFSDGKTTVVSGLIGKVLDNMKIATDESSDEIVEYKADFLGKEVKIIDTPGLFGSKEKREGNINTRLSNITRDYISKANVVLYVTEAANPLPDSHKPLLKEIMRDLRKLKNSIFIINKMDDTGYSLTDEEEFNQAREIKSQNLLEKLDVTLQLTPIEKNEIKIVCIAANPGGKDLSEYWFKDFGKYRKWSHIDSLSQDIQSLSRKLNIETEQKKSAIDTAIDTAKQLDLKLENVKEPMEKNILKVSDIQKDMRNDLEITKENLLNSKKTLRSELERLEKDYLSSINEASLDTIGDVLDSLGKYSDGKIDFSKIIRNIENAQSDCFSNVNAELQKRNVEFENKSTLQSELISDGLKKSAGFIKNAKVTPEMVDKVRNIFFKDFKFKPWGKIKLANNLTKSLGYLTAGLTIGLEIYDWYKLKKANKELDEVKKNIKGVITEIFNEVYSFSNNEQMFFENYAMPFLQMQQMIEDKDKEIAELKADLEKISDYQAKLIEWRDEITEDAEYEEF